MTHTWTGRVGLVIVALMMIVIVLGPVLAPHDPNELAAGLPLAPPGRGFVLGNDNLGRDVWSRFLSGGRMVLLVPLAAVGLATISGGFLGMTCGYIGGALDAVVARVFDILLTLPPLLIALAVIAGFGSSTAVLVLTIALIFAPQIGRVARGTTLAVVSSDYVQAARARGERRVTIVVREIAPNIVAPVVSDLALRVTYGVIFVATLNFLGLGAQPPSPDWGLSIAQNLAYVQVQPYASLAPVVGVAALSVGLNLMADSMVRYVSHDGMKDSML
ncbi:ABC transporter permease [Pedococcus sp. 5OH_020]|uniref:ABC transporter permease n=1 Tax=Pedococcus sp. 5OH_020 TaxID=2989814 RepID=UPI0022EA03F2|nr:ABC transporter permease [Pedococcus sp. 5OH_020]